MRRSFLHKSFFVFLIFAVLAGLFSLGAGQIVSADEEEPRIEGTLFDDIEGATQAKGGSWNFWEWVAEGVFKALIQIIHILLGSLALGFLGLAELLFTWVTHPGFMPTSFTGPDNVFVYQNWLTVRDLANIGIVLGLVYAGLRIALGIGTYKNKKMLFSLLALALLINFTPTLIGLGIDAAQIAMNEFLGRAQDFKLSEGLRDAMFWIASPTDDTAIMISFIQLFALVVAIFFVALLLIILAATFFIRYFVLWILIIISPLAFLAFAVPAGQKFWRQWWSQFISWTFVGVPIAFFIWLANQMLGMCLGRGLFYETSRFVAGNLSYGPEGFRARTFCAIMPTLLVYIGYKVSLGIAPAFTQSVISVTRQGGMKALNWGQRQIRYRTKQTYDAGKQKAREGEMLQTVRRLNLDRPDAQGNVAVDTRAWGDRQRGHAVRMKAAEEIMWHTDANSGERARAALWMDADKKMIERRTEQTKYGKKLKKSSVDELKASIYDPRGGIDGSAAKKRAMALHELIQRDPKEARETFATLPFENEEDAHRTFAALYNVGHKKDARLLAMAMAGQYGQNIQGRGGWANQMGESLPREEGDPDYLVEAFSEAKKDDAEMVASVFRRARDNGDNRRLIVEGLIRSDRRVVSDVVRELRGGDRENFLQLLRELSVGRETDASPIISLLETQGYLPRRERQRGDRESRDRYTAQEGENQNWT